MADRIVFKYPEMNSIASKIDGYAKEYEDAAETFKSAMQAATADWQGTSKDKFTTLLEGSVFNFMHESVPQMVRGLASLLRTNATSMQNVDAEIASNIPDGI